VHEVTPFAVGTEPFRVEGPAEFGLVLWVPAEGAQFGHTMRELTLFAVLARAVLFERAAQFRLVPRGVGLSQPPGILHSSTIRGTTGLGRERGALS